MSESIIQIAPRRTLAARLTPRIKTLERSRAYDEPLEDPSCDKGDPKGLVTRRFHFEGKGRDVVIDVRCHCKVMVGFMKALRLVPTLQVTQSWNSDYSGSYRTYALQLKRWLAYQNGTGYRAAHPCFGYHRQGRALDLLQIPLEGDEREAMLAVRVDGLRFYDLGGIDPPHFTLGARG